MASHYADENSSTANGRVREITVETLVQASKLTVGKNEHLDQYLKRVTHLTLNGSDKKVFKKIQLLEKCPNLKVLYMYDNEIEKIENVNSIPLLTHLHLQHNRIQKMEGMEALPLLEKLYIEGNRIPRLEGLGNCVYLQELHMSNQNLAKSETFSFDDATIQALSRSLQVLNLSNCRVTSTRALTGLRSLRELDLSRNEITDLEDVFGLLSSLSSLVELDLRQNPVTSVPKYREKAMTFSSSRLALLDKKDVNANQRRMMQSHLAHKFQKRQEAGASTNQSTSDSSGAGSRTTAATAETIRKMKHGAAVHQLRSVSISSTKGLPAPQWEKDSLGIAGAACSSSTSMVSARPASGNNSKHH